MLSRDIGDLLLQRTLGMPDHTQLKQHDKTVAFINVKLHATNKQNNSTLHRDIVILDNLGHALACLTKPSKYYKI